MDFRSLLVGEIEGYAPSCAEEMKFKSRFLALLTHPRAFYRDHLPGHITASSWIVDKSRAFALLTHHAKLNRWLQPGGHADGEEDTQLVAMKEAREETGLKSLRLVTPYILDLDIHLIPARGEFSAHFHYDVRYLFEADKNERFTVSDESHDLAWISLGELPDKTYHNSSILRMARKSVTINHEP